MYPEPEIIDRDETEVEPAVKATVVPPQKGWKAYLLQLISHPLCRLGIHRWKLASAGNQVVPGGAWSGGLIDVCRGCGRIHDHTTGEQLTSPAALAAGLALRDRSPFARFICLWAPHDFKSHSAIVPRVSHWETCRRCDAPGKRW